MNGKNNIIRNDLNIIIKKFDEQIKKEYRNANGDKKKCPSYWGKLIFLETMNFNINDWNKIRVGEYFKTRDSLYGIDRSKFIYEKVMNYKKTIL